MFGQDDVASEYFWARLCPDPQSIGKALRDHQCQPFSLAFKQGVGGDGGANPQLGNRALAMPCHQPAHSLACCIGIVIRIFRKQFVSDETPVGSQRDNISKSTPAINSEAPGGHACGNPL